jgi:hypothetical protein
MLTYPTRGESRMLELGRADRCGGRFERTFPTAIAGRRPSGESHFRPHRIEGALDPVASSCLVHLAGSPNPLWPGSGDKGFAFHGPFERLRHRGVKVCDETFDPLLEMFL